MSSPQVLVAVGIAALFILSFGGLVVLPYFLSLHHHQGKLRQAFVALVEADLPEAVRKDFALQLAQLEASMVKCRSWRLFNDEVHRNQLLRPIGDTADAITEYCLLPGKVKEILDGTSSRLLTLVRLSSDLPQLNQVTQAAARCIQSTEQLISKNNYADALSAAEAGLKHIETAEAVWQEHLQGRRQAFEKSHKHAEHHLLAAVLTKHDGHLLRQAGDLIDSAKNAAAGNDFTRAHDLLEAALACLPKPDAPAA